MMASILEGRVFIAVLTDAVEALDIGGGVHILKRSRKVKSPMALHLVRGAVFPPRDCILEGATALRFKFQRVHAPLFPIGELLSSAAIPSGSGSAVSERRRIGLVTYRRDVFNRKLGWPKDARILDCRVDYCPKRRQTVVMFAVESREAPELLNDRHTWFFDDVREWDP